MLRLWYPLARIYTLEMKSLHSNVRDMKKHIILCKRENTHCLDCFFWPWIANVMNCVYRQIIAQVRITMIWALLWRRLITLDFMLFSNEKVQVFQIPYCEFWKYTFYRILYRQMQEACHKWNIWNFITQTVHTLLILWLKVPTNLVNFRLTDLYFLCHF